VPVQPLSCIRRRASMAVASGAMVSGFGSSPGTGACSGSKPRARAGRRRVR
jgi:hypothetical protein